MAAEVVVAFGNDETLASLRALAPPLCRFLAHGHKLSAAVVAPSAWNAGEDRLRELAGRLAYDFSAYDQHGCLSPRAALLCHAGAEQLAGARRFAEAVAEAMAGQARELPRHGLTLEESAALARARDEVVLDAVSGRAAIEPSVLSRPGDSYVVVLREAFPARPPGPEGRFADLRLVDATVGLAPLGEALAPFVPYLSTLGVEATAEEISEIAAVAPADRLCALGEMQRPGLGWNHDGLRGIEGFVD